MNHWEFAQIFLLGVTVGIFIETLYIVFDIIKDPNKAEETMKKTASSARELRRMWGRND